MDNSPKEGGLRPLSQSATNLSKSNLKHLNKHLDEFKALDSSIGIDDVIRLGDDIMANSNNLLIQII